MKTTHIILAIASLLGATVVQAQDSGKNTIKLGGIYYQTHAKTTGIKGIGVPEGADASVGSAGTLLFTYERALTPNIGVEVVLGIPPTIKSQGAGSVSFLSGTLLEAKNIAPTVFLTYHFGADSDIWRPYMGIGLNYTQFGSPKSRLAPDVRMSDSWGLAAHAGVDYRINKQWGLFASIGAAQVKSDLMAIGSTVLTTTIDFKPITYSAGLSYRF